MESLRILRGLLILCILGQCQAHKILTVSPVASRSHYILISRLSKELANAGHDVTFVSPYSEGYKPKNGSYKEIELTGFHEMVQEKKKKTNMFVMGKRNPFLVTATFLQSNIKAAEFMLNHTNFQKLIRSGEKFDVVLIEQFENEAFKALAPHFDAHLVMFGSAEQTYWVNSMSGTPTLPSYAPEFFLSNRSNFTFLQRLENVLMRVALIALCELYMYPNHNQLAHKYISSEVSAYDASYKPSLILVNTHSSIAPALATVPNMVFIGGFHIEDAKPLPKDLKELLDNSNEGVVFFSMGSVLKSKDLPVEKRNAILRVFGKLKQTVLWKYEDDTLTDIPKNVKIQKWLPQNDLLAHPNLKLFITHGGYGSTTETVYHGKPALVLPVFADQFLNGAMFEELGFGRSLPFYQFSEEKFAELLSDLLDNPKYMIKAKAVSAIYRDRQVKPIEEVLYWIDYIVKYNGASHLRVVSLDLPWYQHYLVDVLAFILAIIGLLGVLVKNICQYRRGCKNKYETAEKEKTP